MNRFTYIRRFCVAITLATLMAALVVAQVKEASPPADTVSTITVTGVRLQKNGDYALDDTNRMAYQRACPMI